MKKINYIFTDQELIEHPDKNDDRRKSYNWKEFNVGVYHTENGLIHHKKDCALDWKDCPFYAPDDEMAYKKGLLRLFWIQNGIVHRTNGPAIIGIDECSNKVKEWNYVQNGFHSNSYGPAMFAPNIDFNKNIYEWSYNSKFIIPVQQKLKVSMTIDLPGVGIVIVLKQLSGYVYEVLYGNKKFPIIGNQNVKNFDIDYYMATDFANLFSENDE